MNHDGPAGQRKSRRWQDGGKQEHGGAAGPAGGGLATGGGMLMGDGPGVEQWIPDDAEGLVHVLIPKIRLDA